MAASAVDFVSAHSPTLLQNMLWISDYTKE